MIVCVEYCIECLDAEKVTWFVGWLRHKHWLEVKFKLCFDCTDPRNSSTIFVSLCNGRLDDFFFQSSKFMSQFLNGASGVLRTVP